MKLKPIPEQVAVVLGASTGIGRESALRLAGRGAKVVVAARSEPALRSLVEEITDRGGKAVHVVCDVVDHEQVEAVARTAVEAFGRIDTWVNVAAVLVHASFEETEPEEFRRLMEINYLGQVHGALAALPRLREAGGGALISVSSVESKVSLPRHSAYSASKFALLGLTESLMQEVRKSNIRVSALTPSTVATELAIGNNLTLSLGMVGSLSIIRFRTAIKEPMDIAFLFWSIAAGIVLAAGMIPLAVIGSVIIQGSYS